MSRVPPVIEKIRNRFVFEAVCKVGFCCRERRWTLVSLLIVVPLGFGTKFYAGPAARWVNNSLGGVFYELFWCLLLFLFLPRARPGAIAVAVLAVTCFLEFLQLWHPPFLEFVRGFFIGRAVLGTSFTWLDFPYYLVGCGMGWIWLKGLQSVGRQTGKMGNGQDLQDSQDLQDKQDEQDEQDLQHGA